jgi:hypothetical protein
MFRSALRWISLGLLTVVLGALVEPFLVRALTSLGWYANPGDSLDVAVNFPSLIVGEAAFPWIAAVVIGVSAGVWADWVAKKFDKPARSERFQALHYRLADVSHRLSENLFQQSQGYTKEFDPDILADLTSLFISLHQLGLETPGELAGQRIKTAEWRLGYLRVLTPLARDGHYKPAKKLANEICGELRKQAIGSNDGPRALTSEDRRLDRPAGLRQVDGRNGRKRTL